MIRTNLNNTYHLRQIRPVHPERKGPNFTGGFSCNSFKVNSKKTKCGLIGLALLLMVGVVDSQGLRRHFTTTNKTAAIHRHLPVDKNKFWKNLIKFKI